VLWDSTYEPSPYVLIEAADDWKQLVYDILWKHQFYQHAKLRQGSVARATSKAYGHNEALFIADWLAYERGLERMTDADLGMIKDTLGELQHELLYNFTKHGSLLDYVRERAVDHPNWNKFEFEATGGYQFNSDDERQAAVSQKLLDLV